MSAFSRAQLMCLVTCLACAPASRGRDNGGGSGGGDNDGGTTTPHSCVVPVSGCTSLPKTQQLSQPCCPTFGVDACGAELFCAAFDGRTQATCYPLHSREAMTACDADDECSTGRCSQDACKCASRSFEACDPTVGCADDGYACDTDRSTPECEKSSLRGQPVPWATAIALPQSDSSGTSVIVELSTSPNDCQAATPKSSVFLDLLIGLIDGPSDHSSAPTGPGTFTVEDPNAEVAVGTNAVFAHLASTDASCQWSPDVNAMSGSVVLTSVSGGTFAGSYSLHFPTGDFLGGAFHAAPCDVEAGSGCQ